MFPLNIGDTLIDKDNDPGAIIAMTECFVILQYEPDIGAEGDQLAWRWGQVRLAESTGKAKGGFLKVTAFPL